VGHRRAPHRPQGEPLVLSHGLTSRAVIIGPLDLAPIAREAIESVCSGKRMVAAADYYSPEFVDHVNAMEFHGLDGVRRSVALYQELFPDLSFAVDDQVAEDSRVASRWTLHGTHRGRHVRLTGITISQFENGRIIEDWGATDTIALIRQLGVWRSLLLLMRHRKLLW
jgi:predicted ester cyclase